MGIPVRRRGEVVSNEIRSRIAIRYKTVTRSINKAFWDMESETLHSFTLDRMAEVLLLMIVISTS